MSAPKDWIKPLARAGYASRGLIYMVIGILTVVAAFGPGSGEGTKGAIATLLGQPFGRLLLWLLVVGLIGYVVWRLVQSLLDTDDHGFSPKGLAVRAGLLASAFTYSTLTLYTLSLLGVFEGIVGGSEGSPVAESLTEFFGASLVNLGFAFVFAGIAVSHWWKALSGRYEEHMDATAAQMRIIHPISVVGLLARGFVFAVIAFLLFYRFWQRQFVSGSAAQGDTPGLEDVLRFIHGLPLGSILLALMGVGLFVFALYSFCEAIWRRINVEDA